MVDNQHKKITGYRDLTEEEIDLMNKIKGLAEKAGDLIEELSASDAVDTEDGIDLRWVDIGKTDLQKGFMALIRSVAKPESF